MGELRAKAGKVRNPELLDFLWTRGHLLQLLESERVRRWNNGHSKDLNTSALYDVRLDRCRCRIVGPTVGDNDQRLLTHRSRRLLEEGQCHREGLQEIGRAPDEGHGIAGGRHRRAIAVLAESEDGPGIRVVKDHSDAHGGCRDIQVLRDIVADEVEQRVPVDDGDTAAVVQDENQIHASVTGGLCFCWLNGR